MTSRTLPQMGKAWGQEPWIFEHLESTVHLAEGIYDVSELMASACRHTAVMPVENKKQRQDKRMAEYRYIRTRLGYDEFSRTVRFHWLVECLAAKEDGK